MRRKVLAFAVGALLFSGLGASVQAGEDVPLSELPQPVRDAIVRTFPGAQLQEAEWDTEDGRRVYEVDILFNGDDKEVKVTPEGQIVKVDD